MRPITQFALPVAILLLASPAWAANQALPTSYKLKLDNKSGEAITAITVTPKETAELSLSNVLGSNIASGSTGEVTLPAALGDCLFTLSITFASGKIVKRQDTDICQTEAIIVE
jgi:hypothetical protein